MNAQLPSQSADSGTEICPAALPLHALNGHTAVTDDGLVLKNIDKVENLNTKIDSRVTGRFRSWQICRDVRRDFHLVTSKLFKRSRDRVFMAQAKDLLGELVVQGEFLKEAAANFPEPPENAVGVSEVPLRIVSPEAGLLYRAFREVDGSIAALNHASKTEKIPRFEAEEKIQAFLTAYKYFKSYVIGKQQSEKSAAELGAEGGIS
jgi:hypothetical protein